MTAKQGFRARVDAKRRPGLIIPTYDSPSVETPAALARGGDVMDTAGARSDTGRVALPRPVSELKTLTSDAAAPSPGAGTGRDH